MANENINELEAKHGEKMIEVTVRFWTNNIAKEKDRITPKFAWSAGVVRISRNESHGISPQNPLIFNSLMELPQVIEQVLLDHGVTLIISDQMQKYIKTRFELP
jgi:hypothetical protein